MNQFYESTRDEKIQYKASKAVLQGLSEDGGLFVLRDLKEAQLDVEALMEKDYLQMASTILKLFLHDYSEEEIQKCVYDAYTNKFSSPHYTPLVSLQDAHVLELFHGPTSAFKDVALSILPHLTKTAIEKNQVSDDVLILTATSGDTGKAALEGFKDVDHTKIMVFYPNGGVSLVQETQMNTTTGKNTKVCGINGNFDDAQNGVKQIFLDTEFKQQLAKKNIRLSSANSINIGRLLPQIVYYFYAYKQLVDKNTIAFGEAVNFIVPTGNFGNILAGYYAKQLGLPVHKLVCAANENNVLHDFIKTGTYNRNRDFHKTISPSMDILVSSNLERLLYYISGCDNAYVKQLMQSLQETGSYTIGEDMLKCLQETFASGYASNEETQATILEVYKKDGYLLDPHTAVAYKVLLEQKDEKHQNIVLSTASPYKFTNSVYEAICGVSEHDEFTLMDMLFEKTKVEIPANLKNLKQQEILHDDTSDRLQMKQYIQKTLEKF